MSKIREALEYLQKDESQPHPAPESVVEPHHEPPVVAMEIDKADVRVDIDRNALREAGLLPPLAHERELAHQYRDIKRPLIANAFGRRVTRVEQGNLIMVTSASPGEGKTFTAVNLALSMAQEQDYTVLLVDSDVAKPHISNVLGLSESLGLLDLVEDRSLAPESLELQSNIKDLSFLPAGRSRDHATELLSSSRMNEIVEFLASRKAGRIVIFDTPPLLRTSEAKALTDLAGQVVMVVRAELTSQDAVLSALHQMHDDQVVNLVLNQSRADPEKGSYGYDYEYGYGRSAASPMRRGYAGSGESIWEANQ